MSTPWGSVALVTRIGSLPHVLFFDAWTRLIAGGLETGDFVMSPAMRMPAHRAANCIVKAFLTDPQVAHCDTLCFVDDDHVFPEATLRDLRQDKRTWDYDAIGACYSARGAGRWPVVMRYSADSTAGVPRYTVPWDWTEGDVVDVDVLGLGFTMIRRDLLAAFEFPWFEYRELPTEYTEDVLFFHKARQAGRRLGVSTGVKIGHIYSAVIVPAGDQYQAGVVNAVEAIDRAGR